MRCEVCGSTFGVVRVPMARRPSIVDAKDTPTATDGPEIVEVCRVHLEMARMRSRVRLYGDPMDGKK